MFLHVFDRFPPSMDEGLGNKIRSLAYHEEIARFLHHSLLVTKIGRAASRGATAMMVFNKVVPYKISSKSNNK